MLAAKLDGADAKQLREALDQLKSKLKSGAIVLAASEGDRVSLIAADVSDRAACEAGVAKAAATLGHLDALIHFAGIWAGTQWRTSQETEWDNILAVNLKGSFFMSCAAATHMEQRRRGSIVLAASDSVNVGGVSVGTAYVSSKGGVIGLCRSLARNMGALGIRVEKAAEIGPAIEKALQTRRPVVIDVVTDIDALAPLAVS